MSKLINTLLYITNHKNTIISYLRKNLFLNQITILILIYKNFRILILKIINNIIIFLKQLQTQMLNIRKIQKILIRLLLLKTLIKSFHNRIYNIKIRIHILNIIQNLIRSRNKNLLLKIIIHQTFHFLSSILNILSSILIKLWCTLQLRKLNLSKLLIIIIPFKIILSKSLKSKNIILNRKQIISRIRNSNKFFFNRLKFINDLTNRFPSIINQHLTPRSIRKIINVNIIHIALLSKPFKRFRTTLYKPMYRQYQIYKILIRLISRIRIQNFYNINIILFIQFF